MSDEHIDGECVDTVVVGGGQAGLAMSEHLSRVGVAHVVLERHRVAERWRSERWDSLVANGPAWHDRFPSRVFSSIEDDAFATRDEVIEYFVGYAEQIQAPIRTGVEVHAIRPLAGRRAFRVVTSAGDMLARNVVAATGPFQRPVIPPVVPVDAAVMQMHSSSYRNSAELPDGAVLVVGAGSSGAQIADELLQAGRRVFLSVGPHERPPRQYRGRDFVWWLGVLGKWDAAALAPGTEHVTIAVSGANGGKTVDFRQFAERGMTLVGLTEAYQNGVLRFAADLPENLAAGDASLLGLLDEADAYIEANGLDLPEEPDARVIGPDPACVREPLRSLDLADAGVTTIIWATGYAADYRWLEVDTFDEHGRPRHQRGISRVPGIYFLGLPWQSRRGSSFIWGVWHDARYLAEHIVTQRSYFDYHEAAMQREGV